MGSKRVSYVPESVRLVQERAKEHTVKVYRGKDGGPIVLGANAAKRARREAEREARRQDLLWREEQRLMVKRGERRARKIASEPREPMTSKGAVMREGVRDAAERGERVLVVGGL